MKSAYLQEHSTCIYKRNITFICVSALTCNTVDTSAICQGLQIRMALSDIISRKETGHQHFYANRYTN
jgi:hypothetical protein